MTTVKEFIEKVGKTKIVEKFSIVLDDNALEHHGIKGQKWGIRNRRTSKAGASSDKKVLDQLNRNSKMMRRGLKPGERGDLTKKQRESLASKPKAHQLSDEELKKAVSRMQMEKQYTQLVGGKSPRHSKAVKAGAAFVGSIALNVARTQIQNQASAKIAGHLAKKAAKKTAGG